MSVNRIAAALAAAMAALSALSVAAARAEPCPTASGEAVTTFGTVLPLPGHLSAGQTVPLPTAGAATRYVRVMFSALPAGLAAPWTLTVRDPFGRPIDTIASDRVAGAPVFWTNRLYVKSGTITLDAAVPEQLVETRLYQLVADDLHTFYSTQGSTPNWSDLYDPAQAGAGAVPSFWKRRGESVGMLVASRGSAATGQTLWTCSGVVISRDPLLFLTNDHCGGTTEPRWTSAVCPRSAFVDMSWDGDGISREYACKAVRAHSADFDLAVIELVPSTIDAPPPAVPLAHEFIDGETISVIHHPATATKKLSLHCLAIGAEPGSALKAGDFGHRCDTEAGSSGAPVLDDAGALVGLHHLGFENGSDGQCDMLNKAVRIEEVRQFLIDAGLAGFVKDAPPP